ncbi:nitrous oxide reductase accessory protein NosL [Solitalea sp. MAHUQ-68]|uniref:Nitrous oxide reductase accessory protein NosL n=1 Tax=Solitalea agri TaxID=2953739 RepID=A0A9X2JDS6_9SPHI|nr:nitrous oxide reductase accessory protein NosL [Solitalea agri]MCO4293949.1 nitrous oxide reductase accessory protein NosL [Solitalea agri]
MRNYLLLLLLLTAACNKKGPQSISYGSDACDMCKMNIMDDKFGAEIVNKNGKVFKFDSAECMVDYVLTGTENLEQFYVTDHSQPKELINVQKAFFLHGENINSPMGGHLAALGTKKEAEKMQQQSGGELLTWEQVKKLRTH